MATSLVKTVLEIEREAEQVLAAAKRDAEKYVADAKEQAESDAKAAEAVAAEEVRRIEAAAVEDRTKKAKELTASGDAALGVVKNVSQAAYDAGVKFVMNKLAGK
ncbi:MAG: hypothetical protein LBJ46_06700 [Planctomycetota bacterium]|jgi:F0F1-type ATP synthase membrane subunit b/b'|nr:hypothetical protein [Planctomycetota bacterium]